MTTNRAALRGERQVVRHGMQRENVGLAAGGVVIGLGGVTGLAGQLAAVVAGLGWPSWSGLKLNLAAPIVGAYAHAGAPMRGWPGLHGQPAPPAWLFWSWFALLLLALGSITWSAARAFGGARPRPGFANSAEIAARLGTDALLAQTPRLRPKLALTTPRPDPRQMGSYLGKDVSSGQDTWSSIRQSKYVEGPSDSGKTAGVVIPEALDHDGPLLAISARADVMAATWKSRAERGPVLLLDPLRQAPGLPLMRWNLVRECIDPPLAMLRAQSLVNNVDMTAVSNGDAWKAMGQEILRNLLHAAALIHATIEKVLEWAYDETSVEPAGILDRSATTPANWAKSQYAAITTPERQRGGYYMAVRGALTSFQHPAVLHACLPTANEHFDPASLFETRHDTTSLFMLAQKSQVVAASDLLAALLDEVFYRARNAAQMSDNQRLDPALKFLVDEAPFTATIAQLDDLMAAGAGAGIPTTMVVQDRAQAADVWGANRAKAMWGAASIRQVLPGVADIDQLRELAAYVDDYDEELQSYSRTPGVGIGEQYSLRTRAGMTPAQIRAIPPFHSLVVAGGGLRPVLTELTPYFRRPDAAMSAASEREFFAALNDKRSAL